MATAGNTQKDVWGGSYFGNLDFWTKATATTNGRHRCRSRPRPDTPVFFELRRRSDVRRISANKPAASTGKNIWSRSNSCRWVIWRYYCRWKKEGREMKRREISARARGSRLFHFWHIPVPISAENDITASTTSISLVVTPIKSNVSVIKLIMIIDSITSALLRHVRHSVTVGERKTNNRKGIDCYRAIQFSGKK